jgi:hypothetical protein
MKEESHSLQGAGAAAFENLALNMRQLSAINVAAAEVQAA